VSYTLSVLKSDNDPLQFELVDGRYRLGSRVDCEIKIDHPEVEVNGGVVGLVEVRGEAIFLRNANKFAIYVGEYELPAGEQTEWQPGLTVLLTTSISLEIYNNLARSVESEAEALAKRKRVVTQLIMIGACVVLGVFVLLTDSPDATETRALNFTFHDLVLELAKTPSNDYQKISTYLTAARVADNRWGRDDANRAIEAYQLLLDEPKIRKADPTDESVNGRTKLFALSRIDTLSKALKKR
jgi:hypothetical protein